MAGHMVLDPLLCIPTNSQLHPALLEHLGVLKKMSDGAASRGCMDWDDVGDLAIEFYNAASLIKRYAPSIFSMPFLSPEFCAGLVKESTAMTFEVNEAEEPDFRIPEVVLKHTCLQLHASLSVLFDDAMLPVAELLYGLDPKVIRSIQLAKYKPTEVGYGNWHHDFDSDFTVVVALSDDHTGGGTEIKGHGFSPCVEVPQLPIGHALIFPGKIFLHRGMPVTEGERNLLVFWSEVK
jgi:hypothetical protein